MKEVTIYEAEDGKRFDRKDECFDYENLCLKIRTDVLDRLRANHSDEFAIQQVKDSVLLARNCFCHICADVIPCYESTFRANAQCWNPNGLIMRVLSDFQNDYPILWKSLFRLRCISEMTWVEYPQPYYVSHEEEWTGKVV